MTDVVSTLKRTTFIVQKEMAKNVALWQQNINTRSMNNVVAALDAVVTEIVDTPKTSDLCHSQGGDSKPCRLAGKIDTRRMNNVVAGLVAVMDFKAVSSVAT